MRAARVVSHLTKVYELKYLTLVFTKQQDIPLGTLVMLVWHKTKPFPLQHTQRFLTESYNL